MIKRVCLFICFISVYGVLLSNESADKLISNELFLNYGNDITLNQLNEVLEYDNFNEKALIKKALLFDDKTNSLNIPKLILEKTSLTQIESRYHYISILYRLGLYNDVIQHCETLNINKINNPDTLRYIIDSYLRVGNRTKPEEILKISKYKYPKNLMFLELQYIINTKRDLLVDIQNSSNPLQSYIRIYNRLPDGIPKLTIEVLLKRELVKINKTKLNSIVGNYKIIPLLFDYFTKTEFNGSYYIDKNSDTFIDTEFKIVNGNITYKSIDTNYDNIIDFKFILKDSTPEKVIYQNSSITYDNYPYIDTLKLNKDNIYNLYKNHTKYIIPNLIKDIDIIPNFNNVESLKINSKLIYKDGLLYSKCIYNSKNSMTIFKDNDLNGFFDEKLYIENNTILYGLRDLDSDENFDIYDKYKNGEIIDSMLYNGKDLNL